MSQASLVYQIRVGAIDAAAATFGPVNDTVQTETCLEMDQTATAVTGGIVSCCTAV